MTQTARMIEARMLIGGELVEAKSGKWIDSLNPATEELIGRFPHGDQADVNAAVEAADAAQPAWGAMSASDRGHLLRNVAMALRKRGEEVLRVEVMDTGNTISKMKGDVEHAAHAIEYFAGLGAEIKGETVPASSDNIHITVREPFGVVGRIVPFNHPLKFAAHALAAPLMAGNTVVVKPPEQSSLSAGILAEICKQELPPGVVNIVTGYGLGAGDAIVRHPKIKRIAFTGSVPTGLAIQRSAAQVSVKHVTLELGGKNPLIAFPDQDPEKIASVAVQAMNFAWQGQSCGSASRLLLHETIYDAVLEKLLAKVKAINLGDPLDPNAQMGPLNSLAHYKRVCSMVDVGIADGAKLLTGGKRPAGKIFEKGYWLQPTVFGDVTSNMRIAQEEIFGPILSVMRWKDEEEAFRIANSTEYGLTASIWTNDIKAAMRAARAVKSGYIWINNNSAHYYGMPFGGFKNSGLGREEGLDELLSYTENKSIHIKL
ncbi:MAG: aldehyde dehydrogenase family protein [Burkholderiaceae bacterium]|nr:aldehyde dehydrogenase family protein [Burkholderiaceae bacterium]MDP3753311.1 aldehyde dehydrogenase family protein [Polaromonas sp.]